jgi:hypothetical protein
LPKMLRQLLSRSSLSKQSSSRLLASWEQPLRTYSIKASAASTAKPKDIDYSKLSITKTTTPKELVPSNELVFGRSFTGKSPLFLGSSSHADGNLDRSYAQYRMDSIRRMAPPANNPVSEPFPRSRQLRLPLRIRVFRGHEGIQRQQGTSTIIPPREEHGADG